MLNGTSPVLVFTFYKSVAASVGSVSFADGKTTHTGGKIAGASAGKAERVTTTSIPIYLQGSLFKTVWKSHDISVNIGTKSVADELFQTPYNSNLSIEFSYNRKDGVMSKLIPLLDLCYQKIINEEYFISYFNADIFVLKSKLTDVKQNSAADGDLSSLTITLSKKIESEEKKEEEKKKYIGFAAKITGVKP